MARSPALHGASGESSSRSSGVKHVSLEVTNTRESLIDMHTGYGEQGRMGAHLTPALHRPCSRLAAFNFMRYHSCGLEAVAFSTSYSSSSSESPVCLASLVFLFLRGVLARSFVRSLSFPSSRSALSSVSRHTLVQGRVLLLPSSHPLTTGTAKPDTRPMAPGSPPRRDSPAHPHTPEPRAGRESPPDRVQRQHHDGPAVPGSHERPSQVPRGRPGVTGDAPPLPDLHHAAAIVMAGPSSIDISTFHGLHTWDRLRVGRRGRKDGTGRHLQRGRRGGGARDTPKGKYHGC
ncbi:hypothetical protein E2C01_069598 [Portunus trituberculatus]|uniref:Uncharacterized protein n=1 Tax=Portunus trituberculatus TaxID=210409 RepID=A0A5B7HUY9_PORTR|nr:hypothetical protein [Portunus trituberculatus]